MEVHRIGVASHVTGHQLERAVSVDIPHRGRTIEFGVAASRELQTEKIQSLKVARENQPVDLAETAQVIQVEEAVRATVDCIDMPISREIAGYRSGVILRFGGDYVRSDAGIDDIAGGAVQSVD